MPSRSRPLRQPVVGILGGTSHVVTSAYYDLINAEVNRTLGGHDVARTVVVGMNFGDVADFHARGDWDGLTAYVAEHIDRLIAAGADLAIGVSNTIHVVMEAALDGKDIDFLPITTPLIAAVEAAGMKRVAIFGTQTTMGDGQVMKEVREATGVDLLVPNEAERDEVHRVIFEELVHARFLPSSRARYVEIARRLEREEGAEGLILGCTEIFLLVGQNDLPGMTVFATAELHARAAARWALDRTDA